MAKKLTKKKIRELSILLMAAAESGLTDSCKEMLSRGADPNHNASAALFVAISNDRYDTADLLIDHGADIEGDGGNLLLKSAILDNLEKVRYMVEKRASYIQEALLVAVVAGSEEVSDYLIGEERSYSCKGSSSSADIDISELLVASISRNSLSYRTEIVDLLIARGADVNYNIGANPYSIETFTDEFSIIDLAPVDYKEGDTPLTRAIYMDSLEAAEILINNGADVNMRGLEDRTPLEVALNRSEVSYEMVDLLLDNGATIREDYLDTIKLAVGDDEVMELLIRHIKESKGEKKKESSGNKYDLTQHFVEAVKTSFKGERTLYLSGALSAIFSTLDSLGMTILTKHLSEDDKYQFTTVTAIEYTKDGTLPLYMWRMRVSFGKEGSKVYLHNIEISKLPLDVKDYWVTDKHINFV